MDRDIENIENFDIEKGLEEGQSLQIEDEFAFLDNENNADETAAPNFSELEPALESQTEEQVEENFAPIEEIQKPQDFAPIEEDFAPAQEVQEIENFAPIQEIEEFQSATLEEKTNDLITVRPIKFQDFEPVEPNRAIKKNLDILQDIEMHISVELGKSKLSIKDVMEMEKGSIVELDKIAGEQVEIYVNKKLVARGEVIVIEDKFGVRVVSTNLPKPTI